MRWGIYEWSEWAGVQERNRTSLDPLRLPTCASELCYDLTVCSPLRRCHADDAASCARVDVFRNPIDEFLGRRRARPSVTPDGKSDTSRLPRLRERR